MQLHKYQLGDGMSRLGLAGLKNVAAAAEPSDSPAPLRDSGLNGTDGNLDVRNERAKHHGTARTHAVAVGERQRILRFMLTVLLNIYLLLSF